MACFFFLCCATAYPETTILDRVESMFDNIGHGLNFVGKKASDLMRSSLGLGEKDGDKLTHVRRFEEHYPVGVAAVVSISSEFGEVRVETWPNQVVQVSAEISVTADSADLAKEVADATEIRVTPTEDRVDIRAHLPDTRREAGTVSLTAVNYTLTIPDDANLIIENYFGDTLVRGVGGTVAIEAEFGLVDLRDIGGIVHARTRGRFAVEARNLKQGGFFDLNGAHATFSDVAGTLKVANFDGAVELHSLPAEADVDITNERGDILVDLPLSATPDLVATCLFGTVTSDMELDRTSQGSFTVTRSPHVESKQHIALRTSFGNIKISQAGLKTEPARVLVEGTQPLSRDVPPYDEAVPENTEIVLNLVAGDVRVVGIDENRIHVKATQFVRVLDQNNAPAALEALVVEVQQEEGRMVVNTRVIDDMAALGCPAYRVDLMVECPRTCPVVIHAQDGHTEVTGTGGTLQVEQVAGAITVAHAKGALTLTNHKGDIHADECAGPIEASAWYGVVQLRDIYGPVTTTCEQGKTALESLHSSAAVINSGGDARIIALDGIEGDYDVQVKEGNLSILLPADTKATFDAIAQNGAVDSAIPLTGTIERGRQEFRRLGEGSNRITLKTENGDIRIN